MLIKSQDGCTIVNIDTVTDFNISCFYLTYDIFVHSNGRSNIIGEYSTKRKAQQALNLLLKAVDDSKKKVFIMP